MPLMEGQLPDHEQAANNRAWPDCTRSWETGSRRLQITEPAGVLVGTGRGSRN